jgi:hypothetical protein
MTTLVPAKSTSSDERRGAPAMRRRRESSRHLAVRYFIASGQRELRSQFPPRNFPRFLDLGPITQASLSLSFPIHTLTRHARLELDSGGMHFPWYTTTLTVGNKTFGDLLEGHVMIRPRELFTTFVRHSTTICYNYRDDCSWRWEHVMNVDIMILIPETNMCLHVLDCRAERKRRARICVCAVHLWYGMLSSSSSNSRDTKLRDSRVGVRWTRANMCWFMERRGSFVMMSGAATDYCTIDHQRSRLWRFVKPSQLAIINEW